MHLGFVIPYSRVEVFTIRAVPQALASATSHSLWCVSPRGGLRPLDNTNGHSLWGVSPGAVCGLSKVPTATKLDRSLGGGEKFDCNSTPSGGGAGGECTGGGGRFKPLSPVPGDTLVVCSMSGGASLRRPGGGGGQIGGGGSSKSSPAVPMATMPGCPHTVAVFRWKSLEGGGVPGGVQGGGGGS